MSLPSRERGLKFNSLPNCILCEVVAPLAGAWIEMTTAFNEPSDFAVAPLAGAWIEMITCKDHYINVMVAPLAGAWIEIQLRY